MKKSANGRKSSVHFYSYQNQDNMNSDLPRSSLKLIQNEKQITNSQKRIINKYQMQLTNYQEEMQLKKPTTNDK